MRFFSMLKGQAKETEVQKSGSDELTSHKWYKLMNIEQMETV